MTRLVFIYVLITTVRGFVGSKSPGSLSYRKRRLYLYEEPWFKDGVHFECTGCGKCCKTEGDVFVSQQDAKDISAFLEIELEEFEEKFTASRLGITSPWYLLGKLPFSEAEPRKTKCIFLDESDNSCRLYDARPIQCRTYPFWPRLMKSRRAFEDEAVVEDGVVSFHLSSVNL